MTVQNEMRRTAKTNLEHQAKGLRRDIEYLARNICINLDCGLRQPEDLPINETDSQFDELKAKWGELTVCLQKIKRLEKELS